MTTCMGRFLLIPGILLGLTTLSTAAPTTYDQRQDGKNNVQANLDNFLFVFGSSDLGEILGDLTFQALELAARSKDKSIEAEGQLNTGNQNQPEAVVYETEEANVGREPYRVEIVRIEKEGDVDKKPTEPVDVNDSKIPEKSAIKSLEAEKLDKKKPENEEKKGRSFWRTESRKLEEAKKQKDEKLDSQEILKQDEKLKKPTSKEQLPKKELLNVYLEEEKNNVSFHEGKPEELKLLGDAIENCGPGRFRDNSGVCQTDKNISTT